MAVTLLSLQTAVKLDGWYLFLPLGEFLINQNEKKKQVSKI